MAVDDTEGNIAVFLFIVIMAVSMFVSGFVWPYTIESWAEYMGNTKDVAYWQGALIGIIPPFAWFGCIAALVTFVIMMVIS